MELPNKTMAGGLHRELPVKVLFKQNKYVVPSSASDESTSKPNASTIHSFRDELAIIVSLAWK